MEVRIDQDALKFTPVSIEDKQNIEIFEINLRHKIARSGSEELHGK